MKNKESGLEILGGCVDCEKRCEYNARTATPDKAGQSAGKPFGCNSALTGTEGTKESFFKRIGNMVNKALKQGG